MACIPKDVWKLILEYIPKQPKYIFINNGYYEKICIDRHKITAIRTKDDFVYIDCDNGKTYEQSRWGNIADSFYTLRKFMKEEFYFDCPGK